jgi:hypothetical protein
VTLFGSSRKIVGALWALAFAFVTLHAQTFSERGYLETRLTLYPETAQNDSGHAVFESLLRYEPSWKPKPWFKLNASFDARVDTHDQVDRSLHPNWPDRSIERPALSVRRLSAIVSHGKFTAEIGKQFVRWGKADILNPTDRFAPKDFLSVIDTQVLAITAARLTYNTGSDSFDFVWQPFFTPSRTPLLDQRWTVLPATLDGVALHDSGSVIPGRSSFGGRWNHVGAGYEFSLSYYDGFNHLPLFDASLGVTGIDLRRVYPSLRLYGGDAAIPLRWFTVKTEIAWFSSPKNQEDEYVLYVLQFERQIRELTLVGGYAGDVITSRSGALQFSPERGFARAFLERAMYQIDPNRSVSLDVDVRQNGRGSFVRFEYSHAFGQHWRATAGFAWLRGSEGDFLGQYHRNSHGILALRYSF